MARISSTVARAGLPDAINRAAYAGERVVIEHRGKPIAAVVSLADFELLEALEDRIDVEAARKALRSKGKNIAWSKAKAALGL